MDEHDPLLALTRGLEAVLRGATDVVARMRRRLEEEGEDRRDSGTDEDRSGPEVLAELRRLIDWGKWHALDPLKQGLRDEIDRWEARATIDPAAARVQEVFRTALDILEDEPAPTPPPRTRPRPGTGPHPPRREGAPRR
jgi:hypothetical protein